LTTYLKTLLGVLALTAGTVTAQDYRGRVQGVITDQSQAAIVGAKVTLRNSNTGTEVSKLTNETGQYRFDFVEPGKYQVTIEAAGFSPFVQNDVAVLTRGDVTVDAILKIGQVSQAFNVSDTAMAVEFNTTTMTQTVSGKMLSELPVVARNPFTLALLDPAVVNRYWDVTHRNPFYMEAATEVDVGGNTGGKNDMLLDGVPIGVDSRGSYTPPMDAVQEVAVQQNSVDAEFGQSGGGVMSVSMKSGTNEFHGTAYYFGRNPLLNARSNSVANSKNTERNHIWGGTVGGPVLKNKLFFFLAYEQWNNTQPNTTTKTLPTDLERAGDFSQSLNGIGGLRTIYDPATTTFDPATSAVTRQPFPNNRIPQSMMDPTAQRFLQDVWKPNGPGDDITHANNYKITYPWWLKYKNLSERTDWNINDKWKVFTRYSIFRTRLDNPNYADSPAVPSDNGGLMDALNAAADAVYTMNPTTVVNLRFGTSYAEDDYNSDWAKLGASSLATYWPNNPWYQPYIKDIPAIYYPQLSIGNAGFGHGSSWFYHPRKYSYQASVNKDHGRHYMKTGVSLRHSYGNNSLPNPMGFNFSPDLTSSTFINPDTKRSGDAWASFLLGYMDSSSKASYASPIYSKENQWGVFFQDDFKLSRRITLNLGLRYEYETAPIEDQNRFSRYLDLTQPIPEMNANPPQIPSAVTALNAVSYQFNGAWVYSDANHRALYNPPTLTFLPRAGLALRVNDKTALRIGYARYAIPTLNAIGYNWYIPLAGFSASTNTAPVLEGVPQAKLSDPFPASNPLILPVGKTYGRYTNLGGSASWVRQDFQQGVNDRINFTVQREVPMGFRVDATYFMNLGHNIPTASDVSKFSGGGMGFPQNLDLMDPALSYKYQGLLSQQVVNPFYHYMTPQTFPGQLRNQANVTLGSLLVPYPQYTGVTEQFAPGHNDHYYAMQVKAERAFSHGFSVVFGYNYNRESTSDFFNADDQYANRLTLIDSNNPRHRLNLAGTYDFPFGRGRQFLSTLHPVLNAIIGGWTTSHILMWNSGPFLRFGQLNVSGNPVIANPTKDRWFDTSAFSIATPYTPRTNPWQYPGLTGPGYWDLDSTLSKYFPITERIRLEFRIEAYNMPNAFMLSQPSTSVTSSLFGRSTNQANYGRVMQYTARIHF
jgi:hypothetical protein